MASRLWLTPEIESWPDSPACPIEATWRLSTTMTRGGMGERLDRYTSTDHEAGASLAKTSTGARAAVLASIQIFGIALSSEK